MIAAETNGIPDRGLAEFLVARARNANDSRIAVDIAVGSVAAVVALGLRPGWWTVLASAGLTLAAFGIWAALVRASEVTGRSRRASFILNAARKTVAFLGAAAAVGTGFFFWAMLMGTWIS